MAVISGSTSVRLLVIRLSAMGDVAMVAPVLVALRRNYPNLRITVLTPKFLQPFFREVGNIEFFAPDLKGRHKGVAGLLRLGRDLGRFDMVADLHDVLRSKGLCRLMKLRGTRIERIDKGRAEKKNADGSGKQAAGAIEDDRRTLPRSIRPARVRFARDPSSEPHSLPDVGSGGPVGRRA